MRCRRDIQLKSSCCPTLICSDGQHVCILPSAEQHFESLSQAFVRAGEEDCTRRAIKGQAKEKHIRTQPRSKDGVEIIEGDDEQRGEIHPDQSHRQPADQQVRLCGLTAALLLHERGVLTEVDDQPQWSREHNHRRHQGEVADEDDHINIDVNPDREQRLLDDTSSLFCHVFNQRFALKVKVEERDEHQTGGQWGHHQHDVQDAWDVLLQCSEDNWWEPQNPHTVEHA